jgi:hypothetical protein
MLEIPELAKRIWWHSEAEDHSSLPCAYFLFCRCLFIFCILLRFSSLFSVAKCRWGQAVWKSKLSIICNASYHTTTCNHHCSLLRQSERASSPIIRTVLFSSGLFGLRSWLLARSSRMLGPVLLVQIRMECSKMPPTPNIAWLVARRVFSYLRNIAMLMLSNS